MGEIIFAVPKKGSAMGSEVNEFLEEKSIRLNFDSRKYRQKRQNIEFFLGRPRDFANLLKFRKIPVFYDNGVDAAISGYDLLVDDYCRFQGFDDAVRITKSQLGPYLCKPLSFGEGEVVLAMEGEKDSINDLTELNYLKVGSPNTYINITKRFLQKEFPEFEVFKDPFKGRFMDDKAFILPLEGSVEASKCDLIVDFKASGKTLTENGLEPVRTLFSSYAVLVYDWAAYDNELFENSFLAEEDPIPEERKNVPDLFKNFSKEECADTASVYSDKCSSAFRLGTCYYDECSYYQQGFCVKEADKIRLELPGR